MRRPSWSLLLWFNAGLLAMSMMVGALSVGGSAQPHRLEKQAIRAYESAPRLFVRVVTTNVFVVALIVASAPTCGGLGAAMLAWNGVQVGRGLATLFLSEPGIAWLLMLYVPIEFLALVLATAASMKLSVEIVGSLLLKRPVSLRSSVCVVGVALVLLMVAAVIEAQVGVRIAALR